MKLIILTNNLKNGLGIVSQGVSEQSNLPVLRNVFLSAQENALHLSSTNLEIGITARVPAKISTPGSLSVPFSILHRIVSHADSERITFEAREDNLFISTDNYHATIRSIPASEFPIIPRIENTAYSIEINSTTLTYALSQVIVATHFSEVHPEISGVLFAFNLSSLTLAGTDSFRLAEKTLRETEWKSSFYEGWRAIVPLKTIQEVLRSFPDDTLITLRIDPGQILFHTESIDLISRLIDGEYPDYQQIIPKATDAEVIVDREKLSTAIKLVGSFSGKTNDITLRVSKGTNAIELFSSNSQVGENQYLIPAKVTTDRRLEIVFNWKFLLDGLRPHTSETVSFGFSADNKPTVIKNPTDTSLFYILMPIKGM